MCTELPIFDNFADGQKQDDIMFYFYNWQPFLCYYLFDVCRPHPVAQDDPYELHV